jgi:rifampin ADP-ribosylating transferase
MEFNPNNNIIKLCVQGMGLEETGKPDEAGTLFLRAWNEAATDFEKFTSAYFVARHQNDASERLNWYETALNFALRAGEANVNGALPSLYLNIAKCYEGLGDLENADRNHELAASSKAAPHDQGPFYHGTKADLQVGDLLTPGNRSNYDSEVIMNHIYFTALSDGAGLAAALAKGDGRERVYVVEPTGSFEHDPNVTDKKFPGNPTRSYRTRAPLRIIGELAEWKRQTPEDLDKWRERLANVQGKIIN